MSTVYMASVAVAGPAERVQLFEQLLAKHKATTTRGFERKQLACDRFGRPTAVEYYAQTSRCMPALWDVADSEEAEAVGLVSMHLFYAEQGDGAVFVKQGSVEVFKNPNIYGFDPDGQAEVRKAQNEFSASTALLGVEASVSWAVVDQNAPA